MQVILTSHAPVPCSTEGGVTRRTLSTRRARPGRTKPSTSSQTPNSRPGLPIQSVHPQGMASCCTQMPRRFQAVNNFLSCYCRPVRGSDPLASPAGEAASPGNWMFAMPSTSSATPFSPVQATYDMHSRPHQYHLHGKYTSWLRRQCHTLKAQHAAA